MAAGRGPKGKGKGAVSPRGQTGLCAAPQMKELPIMWTLHRAYAQPVDSTSGTYTLGCNACPHGAGIVHAMKGNMISA